MKVTIPMLKEEKTENIYECPDCEGNGYFIIEAESGKWQTTRGVSVPVGREVYVLCRNCQEARFWKPYPKSPPMFWPRDYKANLLLKGVNILFPKEVKTEYQKKIDHQALAAGDDSIPF